MTNAELIQYLNDQLVILDSNIALQEAEKIRLDDTNVQNQINIDYFLSEITNNNNLKSDCDTKISNLTSDKDKINAIIDILNA